MIKIKAIQYYGRTDSGDTATVTLEVNGVEKTASALSEEGPLDALYKAINKILGKEYELLNDFATVSIQLSAGNNTVRGEASDKSVLEASARAYVDAINKLGVDTPKTLEEFEALRQKNPYSTK